MLNAFDTVERRFLFQRMRFRADRDVTAQWMLRTLKDRIPKCGLMVMAKETKTMGYIFHLKAVFYGSFLDSSGLACLQKKLDEI